jgi:hypothetical protein
MSPSTRLSSLQTSAIAAGLRADRLVFHQRADETVTRSIRAGVLFIMAFWSGQARLAFMTLSRRMARLDLCGELEFVVVDIGGIDATLFQHLGFSHPFGGFGETAWIYFGKILATSSVERRPLAPEVIDRNTRRVLALSRIVKQGSSFSPTVMQLAQSLRAGDDCAFALHDALLECGHSDLAHHFRSAHHPQGCWAIDLILGKQ